MESFSTQRGVVTHDEDFYGAPKGISNRSPESDSARVARMQAELEMGFRELRNVGKAVSIWGSKRADEDDPYYQLARETARRFGKEGFAVITGGGPGIMLAANRGARDAGALSIGLNIELPMLEPGNPYQDISLHFHYFFTRKVMFVRYSGAFIGFPGGFGTMDEIAEALTLVQTKKIRNFPIILAGSQYWKGFVEWLRDTMLANEKIQPEDLELIHVTDDIDEMVKIVEAADSQQFMPIEKKTA